MLQTRCVPNKQKRTTKKVRKAQFRASLANSTIIETCLAPQKKTKKKKEGISKRTTVIRTQFIRPILPYFRAAHIVLDNLGFANAEHLQNERGQQAGTVLASATIKIHLSLVQAVGHKIHGSPNLRCASLNQNPVEQNKATLIHPIDNSLARGQRVTDNAHRKLRDLLAGEDAREAPHDLALVEEADVALAKREVVAAVPDDGVDAIGAALVVGAQIEEGVRGAKEMEGVGVGSRRQRSRCGSSKKLA